MEEILSVASAPDSGQRLSAFIEDRDISVDITGGPFDNSALLEAAARQLPTAVMNLVYEGADMCATNIDGDTPLIVASRLGCVEVVNTLLENGSIAVSILNRKNFYGRSALFEACTLGHTAVVKILIDSLADPVASDNFQNTCLMQACRIGNAELVKMLLNLGVNPSIANEAGETALMLACQQGCMEIAKMLIEYRASTSVKDKMGNTPLILAARGGHKDLAYALMKRGANCTEANKFGETALLAACNGGHLETARVILIKSRNFRSADFEGNTPLLCAARCGCTELVDYLCSHKEPVGAKNKDGNTALHLAALSGDVNTIQCLIGFGAGISARNNNGATPLLCAARQGHLEALKVLMGNRANIASRSASGNTAFLEAAFSGHLDVIRFLAEHEADVLARNLSGMNAVHVAACNNQDEAIALLSELGVESSALTEDGDTPLVLACRLGYLKSVAKLVSIGADPNVRDHEGNSLLLIAAARGHSDLVEYLFKINVANVLDENKDGNNALMEAAINERVETALVLLRHGAEFSEVNKDGKSSYQYCAAVPGLLAQWWVECAEPIVVTGATGLCASEVNGLYDPVSINASDASFLDLTQSSVNFGDDPMSQFQYVKRPEIMDFENMGFGGHMVLTKMKMTSSGIIIKRSSHQDKKSKIFARLNYRGGLPEHNRRKLWEVSRDKGFLWTKFDKQESVKVWSKSQIVSIVTDDSVEDELLLQKINSMHIRLGDLVVLMDLPMELRHWSNDEILRYLHDGVDMFRMKVMLVGPKNSGKSALLKKLAHVEGQKPAAKFSSEGVITADCTIGDILFSVWDLGDAKAYSNTHSLFFDIKSLYLLVWNPNDCDPFDIEIHLQGIRNCAPVAPILIVSTHADENAVALDDVALQGFDDKYGNIWSCVHVGLRTNEGVSHLKEEMLRVAFEQPSVHQKIPKKFLQLQEQLDLLVSEETKFSIREEEFFTRATIDVGLNDASAQRALELFRAWGKVFVLSQGSVVLQPQCLADVIARLFSPTAARGEQSDTVISGVLHHSETSLGVIWGGYDGALYREFLDLLFENDLAYPICGRDGNPFNGHGVSILPELLTNGGSEKHEHVMKSSLFPEDIASLPTIRIKFSLIPNSYFAKLQCRCGFMTMLGSSWKYGFAIVLAGRKRKLSADAAIGGFFESSYALVCMQPRHQTITIYSYGAGTSACSAALHAMIALRDSSFPFMELDEIDVTDAKNDRVGLEQKLDASMGERGDSIAGDAAISFELNMLRGVRSSDSDVDDTEPRFVHDRNDPLFMSTNASLTEDIKKLGLGHQGRTDSDASVVSTASVLKQEDYRRDDICQEEPAVVGSNALSLCGDDVYVSNDMKSLFDFVDVLNLHNYDDVENVVGLDARLAFCVREIMSYCTSRDRSRSRQLKSLWVAFRSDGRGDIGEGETHFTLCPLTPGPRIGLCWELLEDLKVTAPKAQLVAAQEGVLKGLSDYIRKALLQLLDASALPILQADTWIGLIDVTAILPQMARLEESSFEKVFRPPSKKAVYLSTSCASKMRALPHIPSERLLDLVTNSLNSDAAGEIPFRNDILDNEPLYRLLYDFVNKESARNAADRYLEQSKADELTSFDLAQEMSLTASTALMSRLSGFDRIKVCQGWGMQHREFPTTFVLIDSSLLKQTFLSLSSTKSYARLAAVRRMKDIFGVLREPIGTMRSRFDALLTNSMHAYLLCECCLQPQTGAGLKVSSVQPGSLTRQSSRGLLRQGSSFSRQGSAQLVRHGSHLSRQGSHLSRQGSAVLARQSSRGSSNDCSHTPWPVKIKSPKDRVVSVLPLAMTSFHAAATVNGPSSLGRLFGLPTHVIPDDILPAVTDFTSTLAAPESPKEFEAVQDKVRLVTSKNAPASNFCVEQFGLFLMREDPESSWMNFLSRRVASNGDVVFVCNQCVAAFNN